MRLTTERFRTGTAILLAALGLVAGAFSLGGAAPAAAEVVAPFAVQRVDTAGMSPRPQGGTMAETGAHSERLWLLGALGLALAATGLVARAAVRGRRDH